MSDAVPNVAKLLARAAHDRCLASISDATARLAIYLYNPVAIGEHPQHHDEIDKLLDQLAAARDRAEALDQHFPTLLEN